MASCEASNSEMSTDNSAGETGGVVAEDQVVAENAPALRRSSRSTAGKIRLPTEYNLRASSIINRLRCETRRGQPRQPKPKNMPPPLSKYRRKTANARERDRMREINDAFEELRQAIPDYQTTSEELDSSGKITKITTLRLAMNYIGALRDILGCEEDSSQMHTDADSTRSDESSSGEGGGGYPHSQAASSTGSPAGLSLSGLDSEGESVASW